MSCGSMTALCSVSVTHRARNLAEHGPASRGPDGPQRTTSTGVDVWVSTFWVSLPSNSADTPRRP